MTPADAGGNPVRPSTFPGKQPDPIPGQQPLAKMIDLVALDTARVPVMKNRAACMGYRENDALPVPTSATYQVRTLSKGRWHRTHGHHPQRDGHFTVCGRFIPGQRLMIASYYLPPHRGPSPDEVERDRLCCRCF